MENGGSTTKRQHRRITIDSLALPFLATRETDYQTFQYLLIDSSKEGAGIVIPNWALARERLNPDERVNLHVPFRLHEKNRDRGRVAWTTWREEEGSQYCGVHLDKETPVYYPLHIDLEAGEVSLDLQDFESSNELLLKVMKDSCLLKRGVTIYLKHLNPYFSRVARVSREDFSQLRDVFLNDVSQQVAANYQSLQRTYDDLLIAAGRQQDLTASLDFEALRHMVQSEIYLDIFESALDSELALQHLEAIKVLEGRLYYNYNTVLMLYMKSLIPA